MGQMLGSDGPFHQIDFEKAYDQVEWLFIQVMLKALGFGHFYLYTVETLFADVNAFLSIDQVKSDEVDLFRSINQGCPFAPTLYVMAIEALGDLLHHKVLQGSIKGIPLLVQENAQWDASPMLLRG